MAAALFQDAWKEFVLIGIMEKGGSEVAFAALVSKIEFETGSKDIEGIPLFNGGRVAKHIAQGDESVTMTMYPVSVDLDGTGIWQQFHPQDNDAIQSLAADDTTDPIVVLNSHGRNLYRLVFLQASTLPATASTVPAADASAYRVQVHNAYLVDAKFTYGDASDSIQSVEVKFKWVPFTKAGVANMRHESTDGSAQLAAVTAFA